MFSFPPYWYIPLASAIIWLAMIATMFGYWKGTGSPIYVSMQPDQRIAYISDVGADRLKPLFIAMGSASVVIFDVGFIAERWLRHRGTLVRNTSNGQKVLSVLSIFFAIVGAAGLILLSIFDTKRHNKLHNLFLAFFIGGYVFAAIFVCWQYQRLGKHFREYRVLRISFWMKLFFIIVEILLAAAFGALNRLKKWDAAAIVEWVIALIYTFWVLSFVIDFLPAGSPEHNPQDKDIEDAAMVESNRHN